MDFELSEELLALQATARQFLSQRWSCDQVRTGLDRPPVSVPDPLWEELAQLGWLGVACDEAVGGGGQDVLTAAIISAEAGRTLFPEALISTLAAGIALERGADQALRESALVPLIAGEKRVALAYEEPNGTWGPENVAMTARVDSRGNRLHLSGTKILVPDGTAAELFLVAVRMGNGTVLVPVPASAPGLVVTPMQRLDGEEVCELRFDGVEIPADAVLGGASDGAVLAGRIYSIWTVLLAAGLLGNAEVMLQRTNDYAKERVQFGRPIGSFQAVSHRLADMLVDVEIGRSLCYAACLQIDEGHSDADIAVSAAKAWLSEAAVASAEAAMQLHGGIGYTWELDVHLYLRRARAGAVALGDAGYHRERIAKHLRAKYRQ